MTFGMQPVQFLNNIQKWCPIWSRFQMSFVIKDFENEKISQFVGIISCYDQSGDRVSKIDKRYHIGRIKL